MKNVPKSVQYYTKIKNSFTKIGKVLVTFLKLYRVEQVKSYPGIYLKPI
jgi:hypothetical protein